ncbi:MAG: DMT family transporter [Deinococcota bacterium]
MTNKKIQNVWVFTSSMVLAGSIGIFVAGSGISTFNVVFFRCLIAAPFLGIYALATKQFNLKAIKTQETGFIVLGGVFLVLNWYFLFKAFSLTSITLGIISYNTAPFFLILLGAVFLGEHITVKASALTFVAFAGLIAITVGGQGISFNDPQVFLGIGSGVLAALFYAALTFCGKRVSKTSPIQVSFIQTVVGAVLLLPFTQLAEVVNGGTNWAYVISLGVVHTALLYVLFYQGIRGVAVKRLAVLQFVEPVVAVGSDVVFYNVVLAPIQIVGVVVILLAAYGVSQTDVKTTRAKAATT